MTSWLVLSVLCAFVADVDAGVLWARGGGRVGLALGHEADRVLEELLGAGDELQRLLNLRIPGHAAAARLAFAEGLLQDLLEDLVGRRLAVLGEVLFGVLELALVEERLEVRPDRIRDLEVLLDRLDLRGRDSRARARALDVGVAAAGALGGLEPAAELEEHAPAEEV